METVGAFDFQTGREVSMSNTIKLLYFALANEEMLSFIRRSMPDWVELVTLETGSEAERIVKIAEVDALLLGGHPLKEHYLDAAGKLRVVAFNGVGYHDYCDSIDLRRRGIALTILPAGTGPGVAEHAIMHMLAVGKRLPFLDAQLREGVWLAQNLRPESRPIYGKTVGIIGFGRIGREVARRLAGWGVSILYHDIAEIPAEVEHELNAARKSLDTLLGLSDIVTLHVPLMEGTRHLIDRHALGLMKPGAMLINCARGPVVDEAALTEALRSGHLGGAGCDVFEVEPPPQPMPLASFHNVVLTPHVGTGTADAVLMKMGELWFEIERFFAGQPMRNQVLD